MSTTNKCCRDLQTLSPDVRDNIKIAQGHCLSLYKSNESDGQILEGIEIFFLMKTWHSCIMYCSGSFSFLFFYVSLLFLPGFSYNQPQCLSDSQAVCYIFFFFQLLFRIYSRFFRSLSINQCWVNDVHVGGLWCPISIQTTSTLGTMIL